MNPWSRIRGLNPDDPQPVKWQKLRPTGGRVNHLGERVVEYANKRYGVCVVWSDDHSSCRIMVTNSDQSARRDWRDFQRIKNEICGEDWFGYEVYPPESDAVDPSNAFFIWCFRVRQLPDRCDMNGPRHFTPEQAMSPQRSGEP
jgi:hypothetical protein